MPRNLFFLIGVILFSPIGSEATEVTEGRGGLKYEAPSDWTIEKAEGEECKVLIGRNGDGNPANMHLYVEHFVGSLRQFEIAYFKQSAPITAARGVKEFQVLGVSDFKTVSGEIGLRAVARGVFDGVRGKEQIYFFELNDGKKVIAICAFPEEDNGYAQIFDSIMRTFRRTDG